MTRFLRFFMAFVFLSCFASFAAAENAKILNEFTIADRASNITCDDLQKEIAKDLDEINYCQTKDDCVAKESIGCLGGCWELINKNTSDKFEIIKDKVKNLPNNCNYRCVRDCSMPPQDIDCVQNKCVLADKY